MATVISVGISTSAFIIANKNTDPKPNVIVTGYNVTGSGFLEVDLVNTGDLAVRIGGLSIRQHTEYRNSEFDQYEGSLTPVSSISLEQNQQTTIKFDLSDFGARSAWRGALKSFALPLEIRNSEQQIPPIPASFDCQVSLYSPYGHHFFEQREHLGLCRVLEGFAVRYFRTQELGFQKY